jgi:hypothetical protein
VDFIDIQADPGSVFLYRREPPELAELLGVDCSNMDGPTVPKTVRRVADPALFARPIVVTNGQYRFLVAEHSVR